MSGKYTDEAPEDFRDALVTGQVGRWLKNWIAVIVVVTLGLGAFWGYVRLTEGRQPPSATSATAHAQTLWSAGDQAGAIAAILPIAERGDAGPAYLLGIMYATATGRAHDGAKAAVWLQKAADKGSPAAERALANLYRAGDGVTKDQAAALRHLQAAAAGGDADGEADLAEAYDNGELGLAKDPVQTLKWRQRAAAAGSVFAQVNLSDQLFKGVGGAPDPVGAYRWAQVAADHSPSGSEAFKVATANAAEARSRLTPDQIAQSDAWVKAWKAAR